MATFTNRVYFWALLSVVIVFLLLHLLGMFATGNLVKLFSAVIEGLLLVLILMKHKRVFIVTRVWSAWIAFVGLSFWLSKFLYYLADLIDPNVSSPAFPTDFSLFEAFLSTITLAVGIAFFILAKRYIEVGEK